MKKILAMIMALTLVFAMVTGIVVMAEPAETTGEATEQAEVVEEPTTPEMPSDFDESSIVQYLVFNFEDLENITIDSYITATDGTLDYYADMYASYGQAMEETEYNGKRALSMGQSTMTLADLADAGIAYIGNEGFIADKNTFVYVCGTMLNSGFTDGEKIAEVVFDFGNKAKSHEIIAGQQNSFMEISYEIHWINLLILVMCLVVLALIVLIVVLSARKKKAINAAEDGSEFVSEDDVFDVLVSEASEENAEEIIEEVAEETEEAVEEIAEAEDEEK